MKATATKRNLASAPSSLGAVVVTFFLLALLGLFLSPWVAQALIQKQLSKTTGLPVSLGNVHFSLTGPRFSIKGLQFSNPQGFPSAPLAQVSEVKARYSPFSVVLGRPHFKKLQVTFKEFRLMRNEKGILNLPSAGATGRTDIDELELTLVPLTYTDLSSGQPAQKTYDVDLLKSVYRNVKGVAGIVEILNWEILKRTGLPEKVTPAPPAPLQVKPTAETPVVIQMGPAAAPQAPAEPASSTQETTVPPAKAG